MAELAQELESRSKLTDKDFNYRVHFEWIKSYMKN